jgi:GST-like protein
MLQMASVGPMLGQAHHFNRFHPDKSDYARERYVGEARRIYGVLDRRLADREYLVDDYSIADLATWPWISRYEWQGVDFADYVNLRRWYRAIAARPAVGRGYDVPKHVNPIPLP